MDLMRFRMCPSGNLRPEMAGASCEAPRQWCAAMQDRNKALKVKHLVGYSKEQDAVCWRESKAQGLGGRYWETPADRRLRKAGGKVPAAAAAVSRRKARNTTATADEDDAAMVNAVEDESRMAKMESDLHLHAGELTKLRVDFQSSSDVLRSDFEKKFTVFEANQSHTDATCTKMLALLEGRNPSAPVCLPFTPRGTQLTPAAAMANPQYAAQRPFDQAPQCQGPVLAGASFQHDHSVKDLCLLEPASNSKLLSIKHPFSHKAGVKELKAKGS